MSIALENAQNEVETDATSDQLSLSFVAVFGTNNVLTAANVPFVNGVATYDTTQTAELLDPGTFYFKASALEFDGVPDPSVVDGKSKIFLINV